MTGPDPGRRPAVEDAAWFDGVRARGVLECVDLRRDADRVRAGGFWAVVGDFEGDVRAWRFAEVVRGEGPSPRAAGDPWTGPPRDAWSSSIDEGQYRAAVEAVRSRIRAGDVYQANLCRVLTAPLAGLDGEAPDPTALASRLARGNPAPFAGGVRVLAGQDVHPVWVVTASPELFLRVRDGLITSGPIKGTALTADGLTDKDRAENVMIADMVRNDLQRLSAPGTVEVTSLLSVEQHPGLVHLVTTVQGRLLRPGADLDWAEVLDATYPPASVSGAPKLAALEVIRGLEPGPRGPYCGAVGWIDSDQGTAELAVGIRTFWWTDDAGGRLHFGTGAGITWGSDPAAEWAETELKAARLIGLASSSD